MSVLFCWIAGAAISARVCGRDESWLYFLLVLTEDEDFAHKLCEAYETVME